MVKSHDLMDGGSKSRDELAMSRGTTDRMCEYDDVFQHVKGFGRYQRIIYTTSYLIIVPVMWHFGLLVFAMGTPHFHCDVTNTTCPPNKCCDNCTSYSFDGPFTSTVSEWNLICDRASLGATIQSCFFAGMLAGCLLSGYFSDTFGRKKCFFGCFAIMCCCSLGASFAPSVPVFAALQFGVGLGQMGGTIVLFVIGIELVGPNWRTLAGNVNGFYWGAGAFSKVLLAYYVRDFRWLIRVSVIPMFLLFLFIVIYPESPRFLVSKGRLEEAQDVLTKYGGRQGNADPKVLKGLIADIRRDQIIREQGKGRLTPLDLFRTPKLRRWMLIMGGNWFVTAMTDFALYLSLTSLAGDIYLNMLILAAAGLPVTLIQWFAMRTIGRRLTCIIARVLVGVVCLLMVVISDDEPMTKTWLAIVGYGINIATWGSVYLITSELFPTVLRNTAMTTGSACARIGAIISPYMAMMGHLPGSGMMVPRSIFAGTAFIAAIATYWIPETLSACMHQTVEEAEAGTDFYGLPCLRRPSPPDEVVYGKEKKVENRNGVSNGIPNDGFVGTRNDIALTKFNKM